MANQIIKTQDTVSGVEGSAYAIIDGRRELLFYLKNFRSELKFDDAVVSGIGKRIKGHKQGMANGIWKATMYYMTEIFRNIVLKQIKSGITVYFDIMIVNDDKNSSSGRKTTIHKICSLDGAVISQIDESKPSLEEDISGYFEDVDTPEKFML